MEGICCAASDNRNFGVVHRERTLSADVHASYACFGVRLYIVCDVRAFDRDAVNIQGPFGAIDSVDSAVMRARNVYSTARAGRKDTQGQGINRQGEQTVGRQTVAQTVSVQVQRQVCLYGLRSSCPIEGHIVQQLHMRLWLFVSHLERVRESIVICGVRIAYQHD